MLWQPHPRHGLSQPVKTLLSWLKANLILQTSAALGCFTVDKYAGEGCQAVVEVVCVCAGAGLCMHACVCALLHG